MIRSFFIVTSNNLSRAIFNFGAKIRNPSLYRIYNELKGSERLSKNKLAAIQLENTKSFLVFAGSHSPYYSQLFNEIEFDPNSMKSISGIETLPICEKKTLIENNTSIHSTYSFPKKFSAETSGTSGAALKFSKNEEWDSTNRATMMRAYDWYNVKPWEINGYLWGFNISGFSALRVRMLDFLQNRKRLFNYEPMEINRFSQFLKNASFLTGYSSMIYEVSRSINAKKGFSPSDFKDLKLIKGTSESILEIYKKEVFEAFGRNITSEYGAAESGLIAFECPQGNLHINIENVILETNEKNEAIVTNLVSHSFPIIRYNLKDVIQLERKEYRCKCGLAHPVIKELSGRKGASIYGAEKKYPALTLYYIFKNIALDHDIFLNYQAFQDTKGIISINIEQAWNKSSEVKLLGQLNSYFKDDLQFEIKWEEAFEGKGNKKSQYFNSTIE